jgi:hypothetical protein
VQFDLLSAKAPVTTTGHSITQEGGSYHVPKKELASVL